MFIKSQIRLENNSYCTVLDTDINEFISIIGNLPISDIQRKSVLENGVIPYIVAGDSTIHIFKKYSIQSMYMTVLLNDIETLKELSEMHRIQETQWQTTMYSWKN